MYSLTEEHGILEMQRPFPNLQQGTTMLFSIIKASRKMIFVSGDRYGYAELRCMSFMSLAFILWQQQVFQKQWFLLFSKNLAPKNSAILTTFRKSYLTPRVFNIFDLSFLLLAKERPFHQNLKENLKNMCPLFSNFVLKNGPLLQRRK